LFYELSDHMLLRKTNYQWQ